MPEHRFTYFVKHTFLLGLPLALQSLLFSSAGFIDNLMVSQLGTAEVAASGIGARVFWFTGIFIWGTGTGMGVLLAQYWGADDSQGLRQNFALGGLVASLASLLIFLFCWTTPEVIPALFKVTGETAALATDYLQIVSIAMLVAGPSIAIDAALRALGKTNTTFYISLLEITLNIALSFLLIFGHLGLPAMGLIGAGWGTVIARITRLILSVYVIGAFHKVLILRVADFRFNRSTVLKYLHITTPVIAGSLIWSGGIFTYQLIMGRMGTHELAAMAIISPLESILLCIAAGLSGATAILIGNSLGANQFEQSERYARHALKLSALVGLIAAVGLISVQDSILSLYTQVDDELLNFVTLCLPILAISTVIRTINITLIIGVLRAGGDAKFCMNMDAICQWVWAVPMTAIAAMWLNLPLPYVFLMMASEEMVKLYPTINRVFGQKWVNNLTADKALST